MLAHNLLGVTMKPLPPISKAFNKRLNEAAKAGEREAIEREQQVEYERLYRESLIPPGIGGHTPRKPKAKP